VKEHPCEDDWTLKRPTWADIQPYLEKLLIEHRHDFVKEALTQIQDYHPIGRYNDALAKLLDKVVLANVSNSPVSMHDTKVAGSGVDKGDKKRDKALYDFAANLSKSVAAGAVFGYCTSHGCGMPNASRAGHYHDVVEEQIS